MADNAADIHAEAEDLAAAIRTRRLIKCRAAGNHTAPPDTHSTTCPRCGL